MARMISCFLCIFILSSCATVISENPDLGKKEHYDFKTTFLDKNLEIAIALPVSVRENSSTRLGNSGLFVLNLKIINTSDAYYLLDRKDIELISSSGFRHQTLSIAEALKLSSGALGLYRSLFLPDITQDYDLYGLKDLSLIPPGNSSPSELSKYLFFEIGNEAQDLSKSELILPVKKIDRANSINYSVSLDCD